MQQLQATNSKQRLGLDPDCLTGIVMFGGEGSKTMLQIAKRLEVFGEKLQLIFLCGRNEQYSNITESIVQR